MKGENPLKLALMRICRDLTDVEIAFAVVGGLAVSARGAARFTRDVDVAVAADGDAAAEAVVRSLHDRGYGDVAILENNVTGRLATVRLSPPAIEQDVIVDILFASCGIESEVVAGAEEVDVLGARLPVAARPGLIAMKLLSQDADIRPTDRADLLAMIDRADDAEITEARRLAQLIIQRGYSRGRDLLGDLNHFIAAAKRRRESGQWLG